MQQDVAGPSQQQPSMRHGMTIYVPAGQAPPPPKNKFKRLKSTYTWEEHPLPTPAAPAAPAGPARARSAEGRFEAAAAHPVPHTTSRWPLAFEITFNQQTAAQLADPQTQLPQVTTALARTLTSVWGGPAANSLKMKYKNLANTLTTMLYIDTLPGNDHALPNPAYLIFARPPRYLNNVVLPPNRSCSNTGVIPRYGWYHNGQRGSPCLLVDPEKVSATAYFSMFCKHPKDSAYLRIMLAERTASSGPVFEWAHRIVCWLTHGAPPEDPDGGQVDAMHLCHNPNCLHPDHLKWGRHGQNVMNESPDDLN